MSDNNKQKQDSPKEDVKPSENQNREENKELTIEEKENMVDEGYEATNKFLEKYIFKD